MDLIVIVNCLRKPDWAGKNQRVMLISIQFSQVLGLLLHCSLRSERPTGKSVRTGLRTYLQHASLSTIISDNATSFSPCRGDLRWTFFDRGGTITMTEKVIKFILGSSQQTQIDGLSLSPRDSSGYRWCSPRCDVSRHPQCCYNPVCRRKRARGRGCNWHPYLEAPSTPDIGILQW